jgi:two-component system NarL family response regulator
VDKINVLVVNEVKFVCDVISRALEDEPGIEVVATATTVEEALKLISASDVVLVSTKLPDNGAMILTEKISKQFSGIKVLAMGLSEKYQQIENYIEAGADGIVHKDDSMDDLVDHIQASYQDKALLSPKIAYRLMSKVAEFAQLLEDVEVGIDDISQLTPREKEILELIGEGKSNQDIADQLYIELGTVKNHVHSILQKLNVNSRVDAAAYLALVKAREPE